MEDKCKTWTYRGQKERCAIERKKVLNEEMRDEGGTWRVTEEYGNGLLWKCRESVRFEMRQGEVMLKSGMERKVKR